VVCLAVLWRLRYKLSLRDLVEMFAIRGLIFTHEAIREWETKLAPHLTEELRKVRRGKVGRSWYTDETCLRVAGRWCYLYRAITATWSMCGSARPAAAEAFFASAQTVTDITPSRVTTDGHDAYPGAIKAKLGEAIAQRTSRYLNNRPEVSHQPAGAPEAAVQIGRVRSALLVGAQLHLWPLPSAPTPHDSRRVQDGSLWRLSGLAGGDMRPENGLRPSPRT
jgi:transposase-like protein